MPKNYTVLGVSGHSCYRSTRTWPNALEGADALAAVACIVPTIREHPGADGVTCPRSTAAGSASVVIVTDAGSVSRHLRYDFSAEKVYLGVVVILISSMRQGPTPRRVRELSDLFGVDRATIARWQAFWRDHVPQMPFWKVARGRLVPVVEIVALPLSLVEAFGAATTLTRNGCGFCDFCRP